MDMRHGAQKFQRLHRTAQNVASRLPFSPSSTWAAMPLLCCCVTCQWTSTAATTLWLCSLTSSTAKVGRLGDSWPLSNTFDNSSNNISRRVAIESCKNADGGYRWQLHNPRRIAVVSWAWAPQFSPFVAVCNTSTCKTASGDFRLIPAGGRWRGAAHMGSNLCGWRNCKCGGRPVACNALLLVGFGALGDLRPCEVR